MGKTIAYIRASTNTQDVKNQRHEILEYGHREGIGVDEFIEVTISSRHSSRQRRIEELQERHFCGNCPWRTAVRPSSFTTAPIANLPISNL
jgi:hypothetical protein